MFAVVVNAVAIIAGAIIGILIKGLINEKISSAVLKALGAVTFFVGIKGALVGEKTLVLVVSIALGTMIGTIIDLDKYINKFGEFLKKKFVSNKKDSLNANFVEAFVTTSVLFAIGAMAILGSIDAGLKHDYSILFLKSAMDFTAAIMYGASLGIGVAFSSIIVFLFQGIIAIFAGSISFIAENEAMMNELTCVGSVVIMVLGLNLMGITKIKVANMLPAILIAPAIYSLISQII